MALVVSGGHTHLYLAETGSRRQNSDGGSRRCGADRI